MGESLLFEQKNNNTVIVIPTLNPPEGFIDYVRAMTKHFNDIIVVDDGSAAEFAPTFRQLRENEKCIVLSHTVNMGKGRALKGAFNYVLKEADSKGWTSVVTVDSDGQHTVEDACRVAERVGQVVKVDPQALVLGCRNLRTQEIPFYSKVGNSLTRQLYRMLYGEKIEDTQTGLRGIPVCLLEQMMALQGEKYEYELNMLIHATKSKISIIEIPIETIYIENNSESHFDPIADSFAIYRILFGTFLKYTLASVSSALVDLAVFQLLLFSLYFLTQDLRVIAATIIARAISSLFNFLVNKGIVFEAQGSARQFYVKYFSLVVIQMIASAFFVMTLNRFIPIPTVLIKGIVDAVLFLASFHIQRRYIFNS